MMSFKCDVCSLDLGCAEPNSALEQSTWYIVAKFGALGWLEDAKTSYFSQNYNIA